MALKIDAINMAYSKIRISGLTVEPSPEDKALALVDLESMMAELEDIRNICVGYNFTEKPDPNDPLGVDLRYHNMVYTNLAVRLTPDFNKQGHPVLAAQANQSMAAASASVASRDMRQTQPSSRMPLGSGYRYRNRYQRYNRPEDMPPNECATNRMQIGETNDYEEPFTGYLSGGSIQTYSINVSDGLTLVSSSSTDDTVSYRVTAVSASSTWHKITITIKTTAGRTEIREINFELTKAENTSTTFLPSARGFSNGFSQGFG